MDRERWERVQALFHEAVDLPPEAQRDHVAAHAADDAALAAEVLGMLARDARGDSVLNQGVGEVAGRMLGHGTSALPRELGPYRLRDLLGEGGMGVVHLAEHTELRRLVAIKFLRDAWLSPARRVRFASEQRTLAQLNHPCIARLYDADALGDGTPWFAMEYVDGVPLHRYCETTRPSLRRTLEMFRSICEAVLHAHQHAVIHRDLKPSNILVTRGGQPKLLDFGIAKPVEELDAGLDRTRTGLRLMTPAYAAPEQFRGEGLGVHTDIYSLGAILYELLTGRTPFDLANRTAVEAERIVSTQTPDKPSIAAQTMAASSPRARALLAERGTAWSDLDVLCLTAMHPDPVRRYRTVDSLIRDLDHYLRGEALEARPDSLRYRTGKFVRRHAGALTVVAAATLFVIGLVVFYTVRLTTARNEAVAEAERTRRIQSFMNGLFEGGDQEAGPSDTLRVVTLLGQGVREAGALSGEPAIQAELFQTLGESFQKLGNFERADTVLQAALEVRRTHLGDDHPDVARSLVALGLLRLDQSELDEAERLVRDGVARTRRRVSAAPIAVGRALTALGMVLTARGDYDQAITVITEAARFDSLANAPPGERSATFTELANGHFYAGHYAVADSINRRVLEADRTTYGERHPHVASDLINLGAVRQEMGDWPGAEHLYRRALAIYQGWYGENHFETAAALNMVGRTLIQQGRLLEARVPLRRALAARERIYGLTHPSVASTLNEMALLAQREGRLDEAEADLRRMVEIYRQVYRDKHYLIGLALSNLGSVYTDRRDYPGAESFFRQALARYAETLPPAHLYQGITRIKLGRTLLRAGRFADAERETRTGYDIVAKQAEPSVVWIQYARRDLLVAYEALYRPADAARVRAELQRAAADSLAALGG